jgi:hypothetical protein
LKIKKAEAPPKTLKSYRSVTLLHKELNRNDSFKSDATEPDPQYGAVEDQKRLVTEITTEPTTLGGSGIHCSENPQDSH